MLSHSDHASVISFMAAPVEPKAATSNSGDPQTSAEVVETKTEEQKIGLMTAEEVAGLKHNRVFEFLKMHRLERFIVVTFFFQILGLI